MKRYINYQPYLKKNNIALELELTESSFKSSEQVVLKQTLQRTNSLGITFALDDFGIEYSSIQRLVQYPFHTVKIDRSFIQQLDTKNKKSSEVIIRALVQLSKELHFSLIAEGSETKAQVKNLINLECQYAQGFYFYKPMPLEDLIALIKH